MQTTIPDKKALRAEDLQLPVTLAAVDVPEDAGTALAKAELQELLAVAIMNRDAAYRHLMEAPEDVLEAQEAVSEVQRAIDQFTHELRNAASPRQAGAGINQVIHALSNTVAHACAVVEGHEAERATKQTKRYASLRPAPAKPREKAEKAMPAPLPVAEPATAPKLVFQQVSMVAIGSLKPTGSDARPTGGSCVAGGQQVTGYKTVAVAMAEIRRSLNQGMGLGCSQPAVPAGIAVSTAWLADPYGLGRVIDVLKGQQVAPAEPAEADPGQRLGARDLFPPTAHPLRPLLKP